MVMNTTKPAWPESATRVIIWIVGGIEALLLARLTARLFAARPEEPIIALLYQITGILTAPLAMLDAAQPRFGAVLELSTLASMLTVAVIGYVLHTAMLSVGQSNRLTHKDPRKEHNI
jgi:uncharacterized protein YggT (Ycf19 family)